MAAPEVFIDTSGFYALLVRGDDAHSRAEAWLRRAAEERWKAVTTDYVLDETATLLRARSQERVVSDFFDYVDRSRALSVEWITPRRFNEVRRFFEAHSDHDYSFTDCVSFLVMQERAIGEALTKDRHFVEAGFLALLLNPIS
jgi:hypothetical protein